MKKLMILSAMAFLVGLNADAQVSNTEAQLEKKIKTEKSEISKLKKDEGEDRRELRSVEAMDVSNFFKHQFYKDFGKVGVTGWQKEGDFIRVTFIKDGKTLTALYDADATLVSITSDRQFGDLPVSSQKYITDQYQNSTIESVVFLNNEQKDACTNQDSTDASCQDVYFVKLAVGAKHVVLTVNTDGYVSAY